MSNWTGLEIAVIGLSARFPGAKNVASFWNNLKSGHCSLSFIDPEELMSVPGEIRQNRNFVPSKGGVLEDAGNFDHHLFNIPSQDVMLMDPQTRMLLQCAWESLDDSGYNSESYDGLIGLYASASSSFHWQQRVLQYNNQRGLLNYSSNQLADKDFIATRISYLLNLRGPSVVVQSACSSSLVAIDTACRALLTGACNIALAGGVSINVNKRLGYIHEDGMIFSRDGYCRAFDADASGTVTGDGVGVTVLKPLEDAIRDKDHIYAIVKGFGINNDGYGKAAYYAPSMSGQCDAIQRALAMADLPVNDINYVETHGTATPLGDSIELEALKRVLAGTSTQPCFLGSVKTTIGHLDAAAGIAGFIKALLVLKHRTIPPNPYFATPHKSLQIEDSHFVVNNKAVDLSNLPGPLHAGVSSFGVGGTNSHIILEEYIPEETGAARGPDRIGELIVLSAATETALDAVTENLIVSLSDKKNSISDVAFTLQQGRRALPFRRFCVGSGNDEIVAALRENKQLGQWSRARRPADMPVVFVFPGQGAQYLGMGKSLYLMNETFRQEMDLCFELTVRVCDRDFKKIMFETTDLKEVSQTSVTQLSMFIVEYSLARLLMKAGIKPDAMIGHSLGEFVAACLSGVLSLEDAIYMVWKRSTLMQSMAPGIMASIAVPASEVGDILPGDLSIAAINDDSSCVISGPEEVLAEFVKVLDKKEIHHILLNTSHAFHSGMMEPMLKSFEVEISHVKLCPPEIAYISNVSGQWMNEQCCSLDYWSKHVRNPVLFFEGLTTILNTYQQVLFVEVGPGKVLTDIIHRHPQVDHEKHICVPTLATVKKEPDLEVRTFIQAIGTLWANGRNISWNAIFPAQEKRRVQLPAYPFEEVLYDLDITGGGMDATFSLPRPIKSGGDINGASKETTRPVTKSFKNRVMLTTEYIPPISAIQKRLCDIYQILFGYKAIGVKDDFFEIGGDSLKAVSVVAKIEKEFNVGLNVATFLENRTVEKLSAVLEAQANAASRVGGKRFYFGEDDVKLYGKLFYREHEDQRNDVGIICCPPFGQEQTSSYYTLLETAKRMAARGFSVLLFDYAGTGDSDGDTQHLSLPAFEHNVETAVKRMRDIEGVKKIYVMGMRLGASVAYRYASRDPHIDGLVLWAPVIKGNDYITEQEALHSRWIKGSYTKMRKNGESSHIELLGHEMPKAFYKEVQYIDLSAIQPLNPAQNILCLQYGKEDSPDLLKFAGSITQRWGSPHKCWLKQDTEEAKRLVSNEDIDTCIEWIKNSLQISGT